MTPETEERIAHQLTTLNELVKHLVTNAELQRLHGAIAADGCLEAVRDYVQSELRLEASSRDLTAIDWAGKEGADFVNSILDKTFEVFAEP